MQLKPHHHRRSVIFVAIVATLMFTQASLTSIYATTKPAAGTGCMTGVNYVISAQATFSKSGPQSLWVKARTAGAGYVRVSIDGGTCVDVAVQSSDWQFLKLPGTSQSISAGSHTISVGASRSDLNWSTLWAHTSSVNCVPNIDTARIACSSPLDYATRMYASGVTSQVAPTTNTTIPPTTTPSIPSITNGLTGTYFASSDLTGTSFNRVDPTINFDWGQGAPASSLSPTMFSARWTGSITFPTSGTYSITTLSDDGVRVYVDGNQLINDWANHPPKRTTFTGNFTAGAHTLKVEYYNKYLGASIKLLWTKPGATEQIIPTTALSTSGTGTPTTPTTTPVTTQPPVTTTTSKPVTTTPPTTAPADCFTNTVGVVSHPLNLTAAGTKRIWVKIAETTATTLTFQIDNGGCISATFSPMGTNFMWMSVGAITPNISSGSHTIKVGSSAAGIKLSTMIVIPSTSTCVPAAGGDGDECANPVTTTTTTRPVTTAPVTTTPTTPPPTTPVTTMPGMTCTPGIGRLDAMGMGPCINSALLPTPGRNTPLAVITSGHSPYRTDGKGEAGAFRQQCSFSHMNFDDPILDATKNKPGAAHLHAFFGNANTNAFSTSSSLKNSGNSTCSGGIVNRSAYWVPAMINSATGRPIRPNEHRLWGGDLEVYYKIGYQGVDPQKFVPFPNGLHMIAGNLASAKGPTANSHVEYQCEGSDKSQVTQHGYSIPSCTQGQELTMKISFPQCYDGRLTSPNGRDHLAYGTAYPAPGEPVGCPRSHPIGFPSVQMFVRYYVDHGNTANWRLSSDSYTGAPGGYSGHADYMFAWQDDIFPTLITNCYKALRDCQGGLGDGRAPEDIYSILGIQPQIYPTD